MAFINIFFKVDKSQVDSATASVNQAKAATDQLNASAGKLGQTGAKNSATYASSITSARVKVEDLKRQIELANQADTKRVANLVSQYKAAKAQLDQYTASVKKSTEATDASAKSTGSLASSLGNVYTAVKLIIGAQIAKQFVSMTLEASALAGKVEGVEKAFQRAFPDGVLVLNDLRKATKGTITDFELMQRTLQATNLGVGLKELPVLFEFAAARAQQTGESVDSLVDSIVRGIGRKSPLILDNLGLSAIRLKEQFNGAALASQSVADVTAAVGRIAREELDKMGGFAGNAAVKVDQLKVSWEGLKLGLSKFFQDGSIVTYFDGLVKKATDFFEITRRGISAQELYHERAIQEAAITAVNIIKQNEYNASNEIYLKNIREVIAEKTHELILQQEEIKNNDEVRASLLRQAKGYAEIKKISEDNFKLQKARKQNNELLIEEIKLLNGVAKSMEMANALAEKGGGKEQVDNLEALEQKVKDLNEQLQTTGRIQTKAGVDQARIIKDQINDTQILIDTIKDQIYWEEVLQKRRQEQKLGGSKITIPSNNPLLQTDQVSTENIPALVLPAPTIPEDDWDKFETSFNTHLSQIYDHGFQIANDQIQSLLTADVEAMDARIQKTRDFYDEQMILAGDNEKAKQRLRLEEDKKIKQLERQKADREKKAILTGIIVNTALGIIKAIATSATIYDGLVLAAGVALEGGSQYAIASRANYYKDGVIDLKGPGTGTSDSIPSMLSRGESVMTAKETQESNKTLKAIRAKKLNDKVLDRIIAKANSGGNVVGFDDSRLLESNKRIERAVKSNDIVRKGQHIYEAKIEGDNMRTYIRSKSLN